MSPVVKPDLGTVAEDLYARLSPFHRWSSPEGEITDEQLGWPLFIVWGCVALQWQEVEDLARDKDDRPGWANLFSVDDVPDEGLSFLAQIRGKTLLPGMTPSQQRERIESTDGQDRGTPDAFEAAAKRHLTGSRSVLINERQGGNAWHIGVITSTAETPDPAQTLRDMVEQKPWGYIIDYVVLDAWGYEALQVAFDDYGEIQLHYTDYTGLQDNDPPA